MYVNQRIDDGFGSTATIPDKYRGDLHLPHAYGRYEAEEAVREAIRKIEAGEIGRAE